MYNILIASAIAAVAFGLGALGGRWYYGVAPAMLVLPVAWMLLARRTGQALEAHMKVVQESLMRQDIKSARAELEKALPLGKWQILVTQQIYAQMGGLEFIQRNYKAARSLLEKGWKRNWQAQGMLASIDARDGNVDEGIERLVKAKFLAKKEPLMWGLLTYFQLQAGRRDEALATVNDSLNAVPDSKALKDLKTAIANDRMKKYKWDKHFGEAWFQFFPEEAFRRATRAHKQQIIQSRRGANIPQNRR